MFCWPSTLKNNQRIWKRAIGNELDCVDYSQEVQSVFFSFELVLRQSQNIY